LCSNLQAIAKSIGLVSDEVTMQRIKFRLGTLLSAGLLLFGASARAEAAPITITDVRVTIGTMMYTPASVGWDFSGGGVTLLPGQDLVLTQNNQGEPTLAASFNFDTSDISGPNDPQISITANGVTTVFSDTNRVLNLKGLDFNVSFINNEAQDYGAPIVGPGYLVFLGYADNTHTGACGEAASSLGLNGSSTCFPSPFFGATYFQGRGGLLPDIPLPSQGLPFHCIGGVLNCYEGGVIRIVATETTVPDPATVPKPATITLMLTGAAMMGSRRYARRRRGLD
jgi:hypothetical protein